MALPDANAITAQEVAALLTEVEELPLIAAIAEASQTMASFPNLRVGKNTLRVPILTGFPEADWVEYDGGLKPVTEIEFQEKEYEVAELAAITTISLNILADSSTDLMGIIRPHLAGAVARKLDETVLFGGMGGHNRPPNFEDGLAQQAIEYGNVVDAGESLVEDLDEAMALVEAGDYDPNLWLTTRAMRSPLRGMTDGMGRPLYLDGIQSGLPDRPTVFGLPMTFVTNGAWDRDLASAIVVDTRMLQMAIRQGLQFNVSDVATVRGRSMFETDSIAIRVSFRAGWTVAARATPDIPLEEGFPAAVVRGAIANGGDGENGRRGRAARQRQLQQGQQQGQVEGGQQAAARQPRKQTAGV